MVFQGVIQPSESLIVETAPARPRGGVGVAPGQKLPAPGGAGWRALHCPEVRRQRSTGYGPLESPWQAGAPRSTRMLQVNPHWRCGCPNQVMDPDWERLREWIRKQMGEDLGDHLGEDHLGET